MTNSTAFLLTSPSLRVQNRVGELYALVRFLRMEPYAFYYCRGADCRCRRTSWGFGPYNRICEDCGHPPMTHYRWATAAVSC